MESAAEAPNEDDVERSSAMPVALAEELTVWSLRALLVAELATILLIRYGLVRIWSNVLVQGLGLELLGQALPR